MCVHVWRRSWLRIGTAVTGLTLLIGVVHPSAAMAKTVTYQVVTNEIKANQKDGSSIEVYRFDPAVYVATEGDDVNLEIRGLKGHDHPVVLEGYNVKGVVHRNQVTKLEIHSAKPGFYRLICTVHADAAHEGPMEAYLVVIPSSAASAARAAAVQTAPVPAPARASTAQD
jgi:plastocyanin